MLGVSATNACDARVLLKVFVIASAMLPRRRARALALECAWKLDGSESVHGRVQRAAAFLSHTRTQGPSVDLLMKLEVPRRRVKEMTSRATLTVEKLVLPARMNWGAKGREGEGGGK